MNARDIVTARIVEQARRFPDLNIEPLDTQPLDARDAALAAAIDHAVTRRWLTLQTVIETQLARPWDNVEPRMQAILLVGAAQLLLLERLPDHAVINESVEWAKRHIRAKAGGMVNAVLRKVAGLRERIMEPEPGWLDAPRRSKDAKHNASDSHDAERRATMSHAERRATVADDAERRSTMVDAERQRTAAHERDELPLGDGRRWKLRQPVFDNSPLHRVSQQTSHPDVLLSHWMGTIGNDAMVSVAHHDLVQPPTIVHEASHATRRSDRLSPHVQNGFSVWTGERHELAEFLRLNPNMIVQDPTAAAVVSATANLNPAPRVIIDACAGMGTKTRQLAAIHPQARIIATDIAAKRSDILREQFAGHERVIIIEHRELSMHTDTADLLLLDVPCTNTGVLARRVEAKYRFSRESLQKMVDVQRQIIADSLALLSPRGALAYSTCSIEPAENQQQAQWICKWHPLRIARQQSRLPQGLPGDAPARYCDGGYFAILEKTAGK